MALTATRIDYENAQTARTPLDTVVMLGDVSRFHTSYNTVKKETSPVDGKVYLVKSDGTAVDCSDSTAFDAFCFRRSIKLKASSYSSASSRADAVIQQDNRWHSSKDGYYYQSISFYLGTKDTNDKNCSIIFDKIEGPVQYTITYAWNGALYRTQTGTIPAGTHNWIGELFGETGSSSYTYWKEGGSVTIDLKSDDRFNCVAAGPGPMAMWGPETLISIDMSLKTTLALDATSIPASTVDIYAVAEKYDGKTNYMQGLKEIKKGCPVTVWQGYKDSITKSGTTHAAEMVNRTFYYYDDSDEYKQEQRKIHLQARDTITMLNNTTTGFAFLTSDGICVKQRNEAWTYGDAIRGPYSTVKGRYGFVMGMLYMAARLAGNDFYINCEDIDPYIHETDKVPTGGQYGYGSVAGPYEWNWRESFYQNYKTCGNTSNRPQYYFLGYFPDNAPRPLIAWLTNLYRIESAGIRTSSGSKITRTFYPTYVDAGKPKISISKPVSQVTINESAIANLVEDINEPYQFINYRDNFAYLRKDEVIEDLNQIGTLSVYDKAGSFSTTLFPGDEPVSFITRNMTLKDIAAGTETTQKDYVYIDSPSYVSLGKWVFLKKSKTASSGYIEQTREARISIDQVLTRQENFASGGGYSRVYEYGAEKMQKTDEVSTKDYTELAHVTNGRTLDIEYNGYLRLAGLGSGDWIGVYSSNYGASTYQYQPGQGMNFYREPVSGSFTFRGDPRLQPHDVFTFSRLDGTSKACTIETLDIHYEKGGTTETVTYREGIV